MGLNDYLPQYVRGKNILITGATTGIGRAAAILLSSRGANVMMVGTSEQHLSDTLGDIYKTAGGEVYDVIADLSGEEGVQKVFDAVKRHFGKLDVLINNAAIGAGNVENGSYKEWQRVVNINLLAYIACCAEAVNYMEGAGHIVNIGSMSADVREETGAIYVATKSGIQGFSEALRKGLNKKGIKVSLIEPGAVDTDMQKQSAEEKQQQVENMEMLTADDIAHCILYCLSQPLRCDVVEIKIRPHLQII